MSYPAWAEGLGKYGVLIVVFFLWQRDARGLFMLIDSWVRIKCLWLSHWTLLALMIFTCFVNALRGSFLAICNFASSYDQNMFVCVLDSNEHVGKYVSILYVLVYVCVYVCVWFVNNEFVKRLEKKLDGNYRKMLHAILNKSWRQHPHKTPTVRPPAPYHENYSS